MSYLQHFYDLIVCGVRLSKASHAAFYSKTIHTTAPAVPAYILDNTNGAFCKGVVSLDFLVYCWDFNGCKTIPSGDFIVFHFVLCVLLCVLLQDKAHCTVVSVSVYNRFELFRGKVKLQKLHIAVVDLITIQLSLIHI